MTVILHSARYTDAVVWFMLTVRIVPTNTITTTNHSSFNYSEGLYANLVNTSQLGYTLGVNANWTIKDNHDQMANYNIAIYRNGTLLSNTNANGILFGKGSNGNWTSAIGFIFLPKYNYQRGWYQFIISFSKYGYENQSVTFVIYIRGFQLHIALSYNPTLIRGQDYVINAKVTYANGTQVASTVTAQMYFNVMATNSVSQSNATIGDPVANVNVNFLISVIIKDSKGNQKTEIVNESAQTLSDGTTYVKLNSSITKNLVKINYISASVSGFAISEPSVNMVSAPVIGYQELTPINPLFYIIPALVVMIVVGFAFVYIRRKNKIATKKRVVQRGYEEKINLLSDIYAIVFMNKSSSPIYKRVNSIYRESQTGQDLTAGLGGSINTFLSEFQNDFLKNIGAENGETANLQDEVRVSIIKKQHFHMMILNTQDYQGLVFLKQEASIFTQNIFTEIFKKIQTTMILDVIFDYDEISPIVEKLMQDFIPEVLLNFIQIDGLKLDQISRSNHPDISDITLNALKRLFVTNLGLVNNKDTEGRQLNAFDKRLKKYSNFKDATPPEPVLSNPVLYLNLYAELKNMKINLRYITEALWELPLRYPTIYVKYGRSF